MELTWDEAQDEILETTEMGWSIRSQDRLWTLFIYDLWSKDEYRYNRLWPVRLEAKRRRWSYDLWEDVLVWTSRQEAEAAAQALRDDPTFIEVFVAEGETPQVYVINVGDDARYEDILLGGSKRTRRTPRFKGSEQAWAAMGEMSARWQHLRKR